MLVEALNRRGVAIDDEEAYARFLGRSLATVAIKDAGAGARRADIDRNDMISHQDVFPARRYPWTTAPLGALERAPAQSSVRIFSIFADKVY